MKIAEAIGTIDKLKHNAYEPEIKTMWLSKLDGRIKNEILDTHENKTQAFSGYDENTPIDTELLVPAPYDDIYLKWLEAQIDYYNGEYGRYNNSIIKFNTAYENFASFYNRTHMPKHTKGWH